MPQYKTILNVRFEFLAVLFFLVITLVVYLQVGNHDFINYDDGLYVTENHYVKKGVTHESIAWAFTATHSANWHPITWLSHMLDVSLYGMNSGNHHLINVLFHIANTMLLFLLFRRMTGNLFQCSFIAALFAIHPLHVESVAWVAERKDVLSTFFGMLTMGAYIRYVEKPGIKIYFSTLLLFVLGLMSKPMLVTLPFVLLLLDYWPLRRFGNTGDKLKNEEFYARGNIKNIIIEKIPLFMLSTASCILTFSVQKIGGAVGSLGAYPLDIRIANILISYIDYIGKMLWPFHLSVFYPLSNDISIWKVINSIIILAIISTIAVRHIKQNPWFLIGWLWYLGTLVPVIGLVQVGLQAMADRYTYIPLIGIFVIIAWGIPELVVKLKYKETWQALAASVFFIFLMVISWLQVRHWADSTTIFKNALDNTTGNYVAHNNLGRALSDQGKIDEAIKHYKHALQIHPYPERPYTNLGAALFVQSRYNEAIKCYYDALRFAPDYFMAHNNLGIVFAAQGRFDEAVLHYSKALQLSPDFEEIYNNLGVAFAAQERFDDAINSFLLALKKNPTYSEAYNNLGLAVIRKGLIEKAVLYFQEALRLKPGYTEAQRNLNRALSDLKKIENAVSRMQDALKINPHGERRGDIKIEVLTQKKMALDKVINQYWKSLPTEKGFTQIAMDDFIMVRAVKKEYKAAFPIFKKILERWPDYADAYYHIACIYAMQNKIEESVEWLQKAIEKGFNNLQYLEADSDLINIRGSLYYNRLITGIKGKTIKQ